MISDEDIYNFVENTIESMSKMIGENNSEFSRFRNEQNRIYLKLLEEGSAHPDRRSSLMMGTDMWRKAGKWRMQQTLKV